MTDVEPTQHLAYIREILDRTHRRIDPHAFHFVLWGTVVLIWYPLANYLVDHWIPIMIVSLVVGSLGSGLMEWRLARKPRLEAENTFISRQVSQIVFACIGTGFVLSSVAPATGFIDGPNMPTVWALVYAVMAYMVGVVYTKEFMWSGVAILVAAVVAMFLPQWNGYIVGPAMGFGMIVPGLMAERRVARIRDTDTAVHAT